MTLQEGTWTRYDLLVGGHIGIVFEINIIMNTEQRSANLNLKFCKITRRLDFPPLNLLYI